MDPVIKQIRQLVLILALAGLFAHYSIGAVLRQREDFAELQRLAMPAMLLSEDLPAEIDWQEDEDAKESGPVGKMESSRKAAKFLMSQRTYRFEGYFAVSDVRFRFENLPDINTSVGYPDAASSDQSFRMSEPPCPPLVIPTLADRYGRIGYQCFGIWRENDAASKVYVWLADGQPHWNGGDTVIARQLVVADGDRYMTRAEASGLIADIAERNGVDGSTVPERYVGFRSRILEQRFKVPVVDFEADIAGFYRLLSGVVFVAAVLLLHRSIGLYDLAGTGPREEPWILRPPKRELSPTGLLRMLVFALGCLLFVVGLALPLIALWQFTTVLGLTARIVVEVRYLNVLSAAALAVAGGYIVLATYARRTGRRDRACFWGIGPHHWRRCAGSL